MKYIIFLFLTVFFFLPQRSALLSSPYSSTVEDDSVNFTTPKVPFHGIENEDPAICLDYQDHPWIVWTKTVTRNNEAILASEHDGAKWSEPLQISSKTGGNFCPVVVADKHGTVWFAWSQLRNGLWSIIVRSIRENRLSEEFCVTNNRGNNFYPKLVVDSTGSPWVFWELHEHHNSSIYASSFNGKAWTKPVNISRFTKHSRRPAAVVDHNGDIWVVWDSYNGTNYDLFLRKLRGRSLSEPVRVTHHPALDAAGSIAVDRKNRLWIAWHSNRNGSKKWDLPKWFYLRCYDGKNFYKPYVEPKGKNLDLKGTIQGFEFPTVICDRSNRVWIFGRSSQGFWAQYYHGNQWSNLFDLSDKGWGTRSQHHNAVLDSNGTIWLVRRGVKDIFVQKVMAKNSHEPLEVEKCTFDRKTSSILTNHNTKISHSRVGNYNTYFGDIHIHTSFSDGTGTADEAYTRSRDIYKWDFAAITDHDDYTNQRNRLTFSEWKFLNAVAGEFYNPGKFVTFNAYEWTSGAYPNGTGHKNVYYPSVKGMIYRHFEEGSNTAQKLFPLVKKFDGIAIPHHVGYVRVDWDHVDSVVQPVVEICSTHGAFEYMGNLPIKQRKGEAGSFVQDALARGYKFGLIGSSDGHGLIWHAGFSRKRDVWQTGLAAVIAKRLTRDDIMKALKARRCYATSGARIYLDFTINGHLMGSVINSTTQLKIDVKAIGTAPIKKIIVVKNNQNYFTVDGKGKKEVSVDLSDTAPIHDTNYYYVRVIQVDDEMAWSSPIWVNAALKTGKQ